MREWYIPIMSTGHTSEPPTIVFFDGVCGLCNGFVDFLVQHDHDRRLRYAPLQGTTAAALPTLPRHLDSVIVMAGDRVLTKSDAALTVLAQLGWPWRAATIARMVPRTIRDVVYDLIARNRYRWFGKRLSCRVPAPDEATWFLP